MTFSTVDRHSSTSHVFHARACYLGLGWMSTDCHIAVLSPPEEHFLPRRKHSLLAPRCLIDRPVTIGEQLFTISRLRELGHITQNCSILLFQFVVGSFMVRSVLNLLRTHRK